MIPGNAGPHGIGLLHDLEEQPPTPFPLWQMDAKGNPKKLGRWQIVPIPDLEDGFLTNARAKGEKVIRRISMEASYTFIACVACSAQPTL